jgi:osmotically-inducible protein OsmY
MWSGSKLKTLLMACALAGAVASCSATSGRESAGQYVDDASISTRIRSEIAADPRLSLAQINVETMKDVVQLSGFVDSAKDKEHAGELAREVPGVREVHNNIVVRNS